MKELLTVIKVTNLFSSIQNQYEMLYLAIELYYKTYYMVQHEYQDLEEDSTQTSISDTAMT